MGLGWWQSVTWLMAGFQCNCGVTRVRVATGKYISGCTLVVASKELKNICHTSTRVSKNVFHNFLCKNQSQLNQSCCQ